MIKYLLFLVLSTLNIDIVTMNFQSHTVDYYNDSGDAYILIDEEIEIALNSDFEETITYIGELNKDLFIVACDIKIPNINNVYRYRMTQFIIYNYLGEKVSSNSYLNKPIEYHCHNGYLIIVFEDEIKYINVENKILDTITLEVNFDGFYNTFYHGEIFFNDVEYESGFIDEPGNYFVRIEDDDYCFEYSIVIKPILEVLGDKFNEYYTGDVTIESSSNYYINNIEFNESTTINLPGNYTIAIYGPNQYFYKQDIIILPLVSYYDGFDNFSLQDSSEFDYPIIIYSNAVSILLDNQIYNQERIDVIGRHTITMIGVNNSQYSINFTIKPKVIINQTDKDVEIILFGEALLNGKKISESQTINKPGDYELELIFLNEVIETYTFSIDGVELDEEDQINIPYFNILFISICLVGGYLILRKK